MDPEKNLVVFGYGLWKLLKCNNFWRPILMINSSFHSISVTGARDEQEVC